MKERRIVKLILSLIIACLIFQLIPSTLTHAEGLKSHTQNSKAFLSLTSFNTDVLSIIRENQKTSIQKVLIKKKTSSSICQISVVDISLINFFFQEVPFDYRKVIRESIPHYFNGGKYKNNHFAI